MGKYDKLRATRLVSLVADLRKAGFSFSFQKFPNMRNKYVLEVVCPAGAKANFRTAVGSNEEMVKINDAIQTGSTTFLFNLSGAIGRFGEDAVLKALRSGAIPSKKFTVTRGEQSLEFDMKDMTFGDALQIQNRSGHGLDVVIPILQPRPPAPHHVVIEVKSKMGPDLPFPQLSDAQKGAEYSFDQVNKAIAGIEKARMAQRTGKKTGRTWEDMIPNRRAVSNLRQAIEDKRVTQLVANVELDRRGSQAGDILWKDW